MKRTREELEKMERRQDAYDTAKRYPALLKAAGMTAEQLADAVERFGERMDEVCDA
jgi:hypothetical protein